MPAHCQTTPYTPPPTTQSSAQYWRSLAPSPPPSAKTNPPPRESDFGHENQQSRPGSIAPALPSSSQISGGRATLSGYRGPEYWQNNRNPSDEAFMSSYRGLGTFFGPAPTVHPPTDHVPSSDPRYGAKSGKVSSRNISTDNAQPGNNQSRSPQSTDNTTEDYLDHFSDATPSVHQNGKGCTSTGQLPVTSRELSRSISGAPRSQAFLLGDPGHWGTDLAEFNSLGRLKEPVHTDVASVSSRTFSLKKPNIWGEDIEHFDKYVRGNGDLQTHSSSSSTLGQIDGDN